MFKFSFMLRMNVVDHKETRGRERTYWVEHETFIFDTLSPFSKGQGQA